MSRRGIIFFAVVISAVLLEALLRRLRLRRRHRKVKSLFFTHYLLRAPPSGQIELGLCATVAPI